MRARAADETADDGRAGDDDILFRRPEIGDGDRPVRACRGRVGRRGWLGGGAREGTQTGGLGDAFIGDHVSNFEGRLGDCKTEYLFI